jgi:GNAT superfamily N-acetyltransferase
MTKFLKCQLSNSYLINAALDIYMRSFPSNERHPIDVIKERISKNKSILYVGIENNKVNSFALIWDLLGSNFALLDYFAVDESERNRGIGQMFYNFLVSEVTRLGRFFILEVEKPLNKYDSEKIKRINFYLKNETKIIKNTPYILPALDSTSETEMLLMIANGEKCTFLNQKNIKNLIKQIYKELYQRDESDLLLLSFIDKVPVSINLTKQIFYG